MRVIPKWTKTQQLTPPPIPPSQPAAQMPGYRGNWTHSFHQGKVSWSTVFFPLLQEGIQCTLSSGLSQGYAQQGPNDQKSCWWRIWTWLKWPGKTITLKCLGALAHCHSLWSLWQCLPPQEHRRTQCSDAGWIVPDKPENLLLGYQGSLTLHGEARILSEEPPACV